jgi:DNA-directed RNA polymerase specialized sigma24 family protein
MDLTPNQLVAYNLARLRRERGLTQEQAAELLEPHLGVRWSKAAFSQVEQSVLGKRHREFTADDLVAFARAFDVPLAWFFLPPDVGDLGVRRDDQPPDLLDVLFGRQFQVVWQRLKNVLDDSPPDLKQKRLVAMAGGGLATQFAFLLEADVGPLNELAGHLQHLAEALAKAREQTRDAAVARVLDTGQQDRVALWGALNRLSPREREVVYYCFFSDLTHAETAARMRVSPRQVARLLKSALTTLRREMFGAKDQRPQEASPPDRISADQTWIMTAARLGVSEKQIQRLLEELSALDSASASKRERTSSGKRGTRP